MFLGREKELHKLDSLYHSNKFEMAFFMVVDSYQKKKYFYIVSKSGFSEHLKKIQSDTIKLIHIDE